MRKIIEWDWKYRVAYDEELENKIKSRVKCLPSDYRECYVKILEKHKSLLSIGALMENGLKYGIPENIDLEMKNKKIIHLPKKHIKKAIKTLNMIKEKFNINEPTYNKLKEMIYIANKSVYQVKLDNMLEMYLDKNFNEFKEYLISESQKETNVVGETCVQKIDILENLNKWKENYLKKEEMASKFGNWDNKRWNTTIKYTNGYYGEWWDSDITNQSEKLILYYNRGLTLNQLNETLFHEVYPGHAHFYRYLKNEEPFFDHGAMILIEGWATYCEWHALEKPSQTRNKGIHMILSIINNEQKEKEDEQIDEKISNERSWLYSQYPFYLESYYLGALWIEWFMQNNGFQNPKDFLNFIKMKPKGDFMALW